MQDKIPLLKFQRIFVDRHLECPLARKVDVKLYTFRVYVCVRMKLGEKSTYNQPNKEPK
jgi:hypothetical protein